MDAHGRVAVISFHSLEDRIVKNFMRRAARPALPERLPVRARELPPPKLRIIGRPARAGAKEVRTNPRARCSGLRIAEKLSGARHDPPELAPDSRTDRVRFGLGDLA